MQKVNTHLSSVGEFHWSHSLCPLTWQMEKAYWTMRFRSKIVYLTLMVGLIGERHKTCALAQPSEIVNTRQGKVQGLIQTFQGHDTEVLVNRFTGIPFAAPPVGSLRYMPPVSTPPWREVRNVSEFRPVCPQVFPNHLINQSIASQGRDKEFESLRQELESQSEDCLYLNVFARHREGWLRHLKTIEILYLLILTKLPSD